MPCGPFWLGMTRRSEPGKASSVTKKTVGWLLLSYAADSNRPPPAAAPSIVLWDHLPRGSASYTWPPSTSSQLSHVPHGVLPPPQFLRVFV